MILLQIIKAIYLSNLFYGACAVLLNIETCMILKLPIDLKLNICIFSAVTAYYLYCYLSEDNNSPENERAVYYVKYRKPILILFILCCFIGLFMLVQILRERYPDYYHISIIFWLFLITSILISVFYTGLHIKLFRRISLRNFGVLKPFFIALVWASLVSFSAPLFSSFSDLKPNVLALLIIFFNNFIFISILDILFDNKDVASDKENGIYTLNVRLNKSTLMTSVIVPLILVQLISQLILFKVFHISMEKNLLAFFLVGIYYLLLIKRQSLSSSLQWTDYIWIDMFMILKSLTGIAIFIN